VEMNLFRCRTVNLCLCLGEVAVDDGRLIAHSFRYLWVIEGSDQITKAAVWCRTRGPVRSTRARI
jgi:hypothetical protein